MPALEEEKSKKDREEERKEGHNGYDKSRNRSARSSQSHQDNSTLLSAAALASTEPSVDRNANRHRTRSESADDGKSNQPQQVSQKYQVL